MNESYRGELGLYSFELQQIIQSPRHNTIFGGRFQYGDLEVAGYQVDPDPLTLPEGGMLTLVDSSLTRASLYAYHYWTIYESMKVPDALQLVGIEL